MECSSLHYATEIKRRQRSEALFLRCVVPQPQYDQTEREERQEHRFSHSCSAERGGRVCKGYSIRKEAGPKSEQ